jgi:uncharacterized membrane protein
MSALVWSVVNIIDKAILTNYIKKPIIPVIVLGVVSAIFGVAIILVDFTQISVFLMFLCFIIGALYIIGSLFYFMAMKREEASRVVPLFAMSVIWVTILAAIFLGESFGVITYIGILIIIVGVVLISIKRNYKFSKKAFILMLLSTLIFSIYNVLSAYAIDEADFWAVFAYSRLTSVVFIIPLFIFFYGDFKEIIKKHKSKGIGLSIGSESMNMAGVLLYFAALSLGFATLVEAVASLQYVFVFLIALLISIWFPKIIKEELRGSTILIKILAILLIVGGVFIVTYA